MTSDLSDRSSHVSSKALGYASREGACENLPRLLTFLLPATASMYAVYQGIQQILIPSQVELLDPAAKIENLALLTSLSAVASMIALPIGGAVSDRTRTHFGRRSPWIILMAVLSAALMLLMGWAENLATLGTVYVLLWFVSNFYQGALSAILPDRVSIDRRGTASSIIGLATPIGILVGVNLASRLPVSQAYMVIGLIFLTASLALVVGSREPSSSSTPSTSSNAGSRLAAAKGFFSAFNSSDFSYAFGSRFMLFLSYFVVAGYMYYTLQDYVGVDKLPFDSVAIAVSTLSSINVVAWVAVSLFCGYLADRLDRRKLFVGVSALGVGASMAIPIFFPTWYGMLAYSILSGAFIGIYFAVDLALMSLVLPDKDNEGRDFGILAVATGLPQIMSSAIAAAVISFAGGYSALYGFAVLCAIVSAVLVFRIRSVR